MSTALATMAILKANWDERRDYLSNFQPFLNDVLRQWSLHVPVEAGAVAKEIKASWNIDIPQMTVDTMLRRAKRAGMLDRPHDDRRVFIVPDALSQIGDLTTSREAALRSMNSLVDRLINHAADSGLTWTPEQAEGTLLLYLEQYATVLAARRRRGGMPTNIGADESLSIVHSLARHAVERDPIVLEWLDQAVKGSMLANVLHFENVTNADGKLDKLVVFLDTSIVVRILEVSVPQLVDAAKEMLALLRQAGVPARVFEHTVVETEGVLRSVAHNLRSPRAKAIRDTAHMSWQRREVLDHFLNENKTAGDVEEVIANLEKRLLKSGVQVVPTPDHADQLTLDERKLEEALREGIRYRTESSDRRGSGGQVKNARVPALDRDLDSLTAIHRLRKGRVFRHLGKCPAIFLTNNRQLAVVSRAFFREEGVGAGVPHCYWESELVTQLWVRSPSQAPDLPRKTILADSYAALNPTPQLWDRYVDKIEQMQGQGQLTQDDVTNLIYSTTARSVLADITHGELSHFDGDKTIGEVLKATREDAIQEERERTHAAEQKLSDAERAALDRERALKEELSAGAMELSELTERVQGLELARRRLLRRSGYGLLACASLGAVLVPWILGWDAAPTILVDTLGVMGVLLFGLAAFLPWRRVLSPAITIITLISIAGSVALVVTLVQGDDEPSSSRSPPAVDSDRGR